MDNEELARELCAQLLTVAEALAPTMPRVADLMEGTVDMIEHLIREAFKET